jgi:predicted TIM-barrel fold metal-dependent hydrolase
MNISRIQVLAALLALAPALLADPPIGTNQTPADWRAEKRLIDLHQHIDYTPERLKREVAIMDRVGIGIGVNLSGGTVTRKGSEPSEFEQNKALADKLFPGRFVHYMNLDYSGWDEPDFAEKAAQQIEEGHRLGAAGFKEYKRLGLYLRDKNKKLLKIDDPKLDGVWEKCGELGMPVSIHVADPKAFWEPYNESNERWKELKDHKSWWFGDSKVYPPRMELLEALNRVIERHPHTTFVAVHFANNAEDLEWVDKALDEHPNMMADLAARIPEIGRHDPEKVRQLFIKHQDRIFFATDFQIYDRLTLGSGGSGPAPTDEDARIFYEKHWRWLETNDRNWEHMTPIQGDWKISSIGLPEAVLRKIYFDNARRLLRFAIPTPVCVAFKTEKDFAVNDLKNSSWENTSNNRMEYESYTAKARPEIGTLVRAVYSSEFLYLRYDAPFTEFTTFEPARKTERIGLWDRDVLEAFIDAEPASEKLYHEFEVAPTNEKLDLVIDPAIQDVGARFQWNSNFETFSDADEAKKHWVVIMKIPLKALSSEAPKTGTEWRVNFYRIDRANRGFLAWNPTLTGTFHTPARFGVLRFQ